MMKAISIYSSQKCANYPNYLDDNATFRTFVSSNIQNKHKLR